MTKIYEINGKKYTLGEKGVSPIPINTAPLPTHHDIPGHLYKNLEKVDDTEAEIVTLDGVPFIFNHDGDWDFHSLVELPMTRESQN